jgi:hypothetical protein
LFSRSKDWVHNAALRSIEDIQRGPTPQSVSYGLINSPTVTHICEDSFAALLRRGAKAVPGLSSWSCWLDRPQQSSNHQSEVVPAPPPIAPTLGHCGQPSVPRIYLPATRNLDPSHRTARSIAARAAVPCQKRTAGQVEPR